MLTAVEFGPNEHPIGAQFASIQIALLRSHSDTLTSYTAINPADFLDISATLYSSNRVLKKPRATGATARSPAGDRPVLSNPEQRSDLLPSSCQVSLKQCRTKRLSHDSSRLCSAMCTYVACAASETSAASHRPEWCRTRNHAGCTS
jgi:hypothetical protein